MAASKRKQYLIVFVALVVLTGLELGVVYLGVGRKLLITALIGLAVAKAAAVALYFMHLKDETRTLRRTVGIPLVAIPSLYAFVLIAEAIARRAGL
jgi:caa(3)-type oxidase subunit IV